MPVASPMPVAFHHLPFFLLPRPKPTNSKAGINKQKQGGSIYNKARVLFLPLAVAKGFYFDFKNKNKWFEAASSSLMGVV